MEIVVLGLIFDIIGVLILVGVSVWNPFYQRREDLKWWKKRYWWHGWRPIFKIHPPSGKTKWKIKLNHIVIIHGFIPQKHKGNIIGFLCILVGFILQLKFYLS